MITPTLRFSTNSMISEFYVEAGIVALQRLALVDRNDRAQKRRRPPCPYSEVLGKPVKIDKSVYAL